MSIIALSVLVTLSVLMRTSSVSASPWSPSDQPPTSEAPAPDRITPPSQEFPPIPVRSASKLEPGFANADELLTALEDADKGMSSLIADIVYDKTIATVGARETRSGRLYFNNSAKDRRFAIEFDTFVRGDGTVDQQPRSYVFDGQWLLDRNNSERRYTKKQVVPPGQTFDPLKIGEGPFPVPIGQKRQDILSRYNAQLLPSDDGLDSSDDTQKKLIAFVKGAHQLRLVPRADRPDQDRFKEIRLWYRADPKDGGRLLPRMARTIATSPEPGEDGDVSLVRLVNVRLNQPIAPLILDTSTPPASEGWDGVVTDFREPAGG